MSYSRAKTAVHKRFNSSVVVDEKCDSCSCPPILLLARGGVIVTIRPACVCVCVRAYVCTCKDVRVHECACACVIVTIKPACVRVCMRAYVCTHVDVRVRACAGMIVTM